MLPPAGQGVVFLHKAVTVCVINGVEARYVSLNNQLHSPEEILQIMPISICLSLTGTIKPPSSL